MRYAHVPWSPKPPPPPPPLSPLVSPPPRVVADWNPFLRASGRFHVSRQRRVRIVEALNGAMPGSVEYTNLVRSWDSPVAFWIDGKSALLSKERRRTVTVDADDDADDDEQPLPRPQPHQAQPRSPRISPAASTASTAGTGETVEGLLREAASSSPALLVTLVLHALPNRDCHHPLPEGQICCRYQTGRSRCDFRETVTSCDIGLEEYKTDVVDVLAWLLERHSGRVPVAVVLEPGSISSLALGSKHPACASAATVHAYTEGVRYAVEQIRKRAPSVTLYLDAGDGATHGWGKYARSYATLVSGLGEAALSLRGFATNVGGYQPLGTPCPAAAADAPLHQYCRVVPHDACCADPCGLFDAFNSGTTELNYVQLLRRHLSVAIPALSPRFIVDTGRNGADGVRRDCEAVCNARGAGLGRRPTAETGLDIVDAFFWIWPPGASDGCFNREQQSSSQTPHTCLRSDASCDLDGALGAREGEPVQPKRGEFFPSHLHRLAAHGSGHGDATLSGGAMGQVLREIISFAASARISTNVVPEQRSSPSALAFIFSEGYSELVYAGGGALLAVVAALIARIVRSRRGGGRVNVRGKLSEWIGCVTRVASRRRMADYAAPGSRSAPPSAAFSISHADDVDADPGDAACANRAFAIVD